MTKRFGPTVACDQVDFSLRRGEIHGILGENGAGKSTLMRMPMGLVLPDEGTITIDGSEQFITDPKAAAELGIGMVHQHYSLVDALTVWENVALGETGPLHPDTTKERVREISDRYGLDIDPDAYIRDLPAGLRQRVEIIKCLRHAPRIIIMDEPTAVLTPAESEHLFQVLRIGVETEGWSVALVSHKLDEILSVTDRITIMRDGRVVDEVTTSGADAGSLARAMVGRSVTLRSASAAIGALAVHEVLANDEPANSVKTPVLEVVDAHARADDGEVLLNGLSLSICAGEVVGIAGAAGNGQGPLTDVLMSLLKLTSGTVAMGETQIPTGAAGAMAKAGIAAIPADRFDSGCIPEMSVAENLVLSSVASFSRGGVIQQAEIDQRAATMIRDFDIHTPSVDTPFGQLSGGNQQRVVLARELGREPKVLVASQPSRGLDVGAIEYIGERIRHAADEGVGVLLISTDLSEIIALSDRILVIYRGRIIGEMARSELDVERLGLLIGGTTEDEDAT
ncbi:MAG: ABC transporter ATP-binding protein [Acidimicrobiia bacterium]